MIMINWLNPTLPETARSGKATPLSALDIRCGMELANADKDCVFRDET